MMALGFDMGCMVHGDAGPDSKTVERDLCSKYAGKYALGRGLQHSKVLEAQPLGVVSAGLANVNTKECHTINRLVPNNVCR